MGFVLILVAANYHQAIVCGGGMSGGGRGKWRRKGERIRESREKREERGGQGGGVEGEGGGERGDKGEI